MPQSPNPDSALYQANDSSRYRWLLRAIIAAIILAVPACLILWLYLYAVSPSLSQNKEDITVYIPPGSGVREIGTILNNTGVIDGGNRFLVLAKVMGVARSLKAGEYVFSINHTPRQILNDLAQGKTFLRSITIPEGNNIFQIADLIAAQGWATQQEFLDLTQSQSLLREFSLNVKSLEGYLFPDTYLFPKGENINTVIKKMVDRTELILAEECKKANAVKFSFSCSEPSNFQTLIGKKSSNPIEKTVAGKNNLSNHQVLILASIIEKETGLAIERPLVAGVFLNRLVRKMKLQADPTVIYGLKKFGAPLTRKDLKTAGPYNTYVSRGLPAGPICNPGRASIAAVFRPSNKPYYYFVSQNDGSHVFSKSLKEHNRAVKKFRQATAQKK